MTLETQRPPRRILRGWRNHPPPCPWCGSEDTWLFDVYFGAPVWSCMNEACPNVEHERFFDLKDVERAAKHD